MLIVIGTARITPSARDQFLAAAKIVVDETKNDDGSQAYGFYSDISDENVIVGMETWRDRAALDAHMSHRHTTDFLTATASLIVGEPVVSIHEVN